MLPERNREHFATYHWQQVQYMIEYKKEHLRAPELLRMSWLLGWLEGFCFSAFFSVTCCFLKGSPHLALSIRWSFQHLCFTLHTCCSSARQPASTFQNHCHSQIQVKAVSCEEEATCVHGPQASLPSQSQSSFKMGWGKCQSAVWADKSKFEHSVWKTLTL